MQGYFDLLQNTDVTTKNTPSSINENSRRLVIVSEDHTRIEKHSKYLTRYYSLALARMMVLYTWIEKHLGMELLPYRRGAS